MILEFLFRQFADTHPLVIIKRILAFELGRFMREHFCFQVKPGGDAPLPAVAEYRGVPLHVGLLGVLG